MGAISERGADIVVINPGSANLRIGFAHAYRQAPVVVPHCIAHFVLTSKAGRELRENGAIGEQGFQTNMISPEKNLEREEISQKVELQLKLSPRFSDQGSLVAPREGNGWKIAPQSEDGSFHWTKVILEEEAILPVGAEDSNQKPPKATAGEVGEEMVTSNQIHRQPELPTPKVWSYKKHIFGEEALKIPAGKPYILRRPIRRGQLNITQEYSLRQVCDDLFSIWDWVLSEKLGLDPKFRQQFSVVLVVPDTLDNREVKEMLSIVLRDLQFRSAVVHQECVAASFGDGVSSACVVNMGAQVTSVICIEDGVAIPLTRVVLPFGGEDISRCLLWIQQRWETWPSIDTDPLHDSLDLEMLERLKEGYCLIGEGEQRATVNIHFRTAGMPTRVYKTSLTALNVPPMGLFYPSLLAVDDYAAPIRPWFHADYEDTVEDIFHVEPTKKLDITDVGLAPGANGGTSLPSGTAEGPDNNLETTRLSTDGAMLSISQAIIKSILSIGRQDIQKKLFASIQLVGGVALTRGLVDALEERVLHAIPAHEAVDTVEVLSHRTDPTITVWKGGAVLGVLDLYRDAWLQYDDWMEGGARVGSGRKYKDSNPLQTQCFWYSASE